MPSSSPRPEPAPAARFERAWRALAARRGWAADDLLADLLARYGEAGRHYHGVDHVRDLLDRLEELEFSDRDAVEAATFLHDAIYRVGATDNEARSADLARERLGGIDSAGFAERVAAICAATATHEATGDPDTDLFLDVDMAVLGDPPAAYRRYREAVLREYTTVFQRESYLVGRITLFVEPMLERERIFLSDAFADREEQARANLREERDWLRAGAVT